MKRKEVLIAVIGGCFGALVTMGVGLFSPVGVVAQNQDVVFGKITCTEIEVIDSLGERRCFIFSGTEGGTVLVSGKGEGKAVMGINEYGNGAISAWDKNGNRR